MIRESARTQNAQGIPFHGNSIRPGAIHFPDFKQPDQALVVIEVPLCRSHQPRRQRGAHVLRIFGQRISDRDALALQRRKFRVIRFGGKAEIDGFLISLADHECSEWNFPEHRPGNGSRRFCSGEEWPEYSDSRRSAPVPQSDPLPVPCPPGRSDR